MLPCNLIFEGVGRCGKTTLINAIVECQRKIGMKVTKYKMYVPTSRSEGYRQYDTYANVLAANRNDVVIYDRGHISEFVYAPYYRDYYTVDYQQFLHNIDRDIVECTNVPTYIVYVYPRWQSLMIPGNRPTDDLIAVPRLYEEALYHTRCDVIRISTHDRYFQLWKSIHNLVTELLVKIT